MIDQLTCRRKGCDKVPRPGQLACQADWFALPPELRSRINRSWRALRGGDHNALEVYRLAVHEAMIVWAAS